MKYWIAKTLHITSYAPWWLFSKIVFGLDINNNDNSKAIDKNRGVLVVSNHLTEIDPFIIGLSFHPLSSVHPIQFLAKEKLFKIPFVGQLIWLYGSLKLDRSLGMEEGLKEARRKLLNGNTVGIFPEGKVARIHKERKPKKGVAYLVKETNPTIVPVFIDGEGSASFLDFMLRKKKLRIHRGKAFRIADDNRENMSLEELTELIMKKVEGAKETKQQS